MALGLGVEVGFTAAFRVSALAGADVAVGAGVGLGVAVGMGVGVGCGAGVAVTTTSTSLTTSLTMISRSITCGSGVAQAVRENGASAAKRRAAMRAVVGSFIRVCGSCGLVFLAWCFRLGQSYRVWARVSSGVAFPRTR